MGKLNKKNVGAAFLAAFIISAACEAYAGQLQLSMPLDCNYGENCFIQNYVDAEKNFDYQDFKCNKLSYDKHNGTDFRLLNLKQMKDGVKVLSATGGTVIGVRDGVDDISIRDGGKEKIKGIECGNGVVISPEPKLYTQYCHMKKGSIRVKKGETVKQGDVLGEVGLSGGTEFPHLHFQIWRGQTFLDPFTGGSMENGCQKTSSDTLWDDQTEDLLQYIPTGILGAGFTDKEPAQKEMESGELKSELKADSPAAIFWVQLFGVRPDYKLTVTITAPDGEELASHTQTIEKHKATLPQFVGKKFQEPLGMGTYTGKVSVTSKTGVVLEKTFQTEVK